MTVKSVKDRLLETNEVLHMYDGTCPPNLVQIWLRRYWKEPNDRLSTEVSIRKAIDDAIDMCAKKQTRQEVLLGWGFTEEEANELLADLGT